MREAKKVRAANLPHPLDGSTAELSDSDARAYAARQAPEGFALARCVQGVVQGRRVLFVTFERGADAEEVLERAEELHAWGGLDRERWAELTERLQRLASSEPRDQIEQARERLNELAGRNGDGDLAGWLEEEGRGEA